jgi:hypothetical protein
MTTLGRLPLQFKVLFTGFLVAIGAGLLMAGLQIMLTHGMADGKIGLSVTDVVYSYYGNRSGSTLEFMLNGQMKPMAPDDARFELIEWAQDGAPADQWAPKIKPLVNQYCVSCHMRQRLLAGMARSSSNCSPAVCASSFTASKSRMPIRCACALSERSNAALLWLV